MIQKLADILIQKKLTVGVAESCTGGLISSLLTDISGSSAYIKFNVITYSNEAKIKYLNVKEKTLQEFGAVSSQVAEEMAYGIKNLSNTDIGLSITGIAGPTGGSIEKPVGLVYIGIYNGSELEIKEFKSNPLLSREEIKQNSASKALELLYQFIKKTY